jgi:glycosyltransferase involved in cell wall biosynthesis
MAITNYINLKVLFKIAFINLFILFIFQKLRQMNSKISVIIPTFNREKLIGNSINSVLEQTFQNFEIIIVDDGSTDNTKKEIDKFQDERIKYIKLQNNTGGANARNVGIEIASGQYISFQDSDDIFYPDKLEKQLKNINNKHSHLDFCKINVIFNESFHYLVPTIEREKRIDKGNLFDELVTHGNFISTQSILVKTSFMKKYKFDPNMPRLQDYDVLLRMIPKVKISYTREILVDLHIQKSSVQLSSDKLKKAIYLLLNKKFNFNEKQRKSFSNYLNYLLKTHM